MTELSTKSIKWKIAQNLERKWWKRYLKGKDITTYKNWKKDYWNNFFSHVSHQVPISEHTSVADIGCGPAGIFTIFHQHEVVAVDPLLDSYERDLAVFNRDEYPNVSFVVSAIEDYVAHKTFDLVCCLNAINHVSNMEEGLRKLSAITSPNGYCMLSIDAHNFEGLKYLFRAIPGDALHPHQYNLGEYQQLFKESGFELVKTVLIKKELIFNYYLLLGKKINA